MLSTKSLGTASSGIASYYEHLSADDYYQSGTEPPGKWQGRLAGVLGLGGEVQSGQLRQLFEGLDPLSGRALATNAGEQHKAGWDATFSAPKSVSIAWAFAEEAMQAEIAQAHDEAVKASLAYLEANAFKSRDRDGGRPLQGVIAAVFQHSTSREQDPQLHSHCAIANIGIRSDGTICAVDFDSRWKMAAGAIYRAELALRMRQLGFDVERDGKSFRLAAVPEALCKVFSKRREQITQALERTGFTSAKAHDIAALSTRRNKELAEREILRRQWQQEAEESGYPPETVQALFVPKVQEAYSPYGTAPAVDGPAIISELTRGEAVFTRAQFEAAIATAAQGQAGAGEIPNLIAAAIETGLASEADTGLVQLESMPEQYDSRRQITRFTTREMLRLEQEAVAGAVQRQGERRHAVSVAEALLKGLSEEQARAVRHVVIDSGGVKCVRGLAGTGKSFMLSRARQAWEEAGLQVTGTALAGKAADGLQSGSGIASQTLHSLLNEIEQGQRRLDDRTVVVIDEAGMIGTRQMHRLLGHVHAAGAKVVLVGDHQQLQPIDAGGVFRKLSEELGYAGLEEIRRQQDARDIGMIKTLIGGDALAAIEQLSQSGQLIVAADDRVAAELVADWLAQRDAQRPGEFLMLAGTKSDVKKLNLLARQRLMENGRLHSAMTIETDAGEKELAIGERVLFTRNNRMLGVRNGQLGTLEGWRLDPRSGGIEMMVRLDDGETVRFDSAEYNHLDHGYAISTHKAQGVTCDQVNVLLSESMTDREWSYVAMSRHRQRLRVFAPAGMEEDLDRALGRSRQKELASDYVVTAPAVALVPKAAQELEC
jgi:conjugative relaxase-like TrwC/TraI family protein